MNKCLILFLSLLAVSVNAEITEKDFPRVVAAIYKIEGGNKTKFPFGIKSIKYSGPESGRKEWAKKICENTVKNNYIRWSKKKNTDFLTFLASRYCPEISDSTGHKNWIRNIKAILKN